MASWSFVVLCHVRGPPVESAVMAVNPHRLYISNLQAAQLTRDWEEEINYWNIKLQSANTWRAGKFVLASS